MKVIKYFYLDDEKQWLSYLPNLPEPWVQGETFEALQVNLYRLNFDLMLLDALRRVF